MLQSFLLGASAPHADVVQLVERDPSKVDVAGSSPVIRSFQGRSLASAEMVRLLLINRAPQSLTDLERRVAEEKRVRGTTTDYGAAW